MEMMVHYSTEAVRELIADTLQLYVGLGKRLSWADLAGATGIKEGTLRSYVEAGGSLMPLPVFMNVFSKLPPEAFARVARYMGFSAGPLAIEDNIAVRRAMTQASRLVAEGNEALEDGELNHVERARIRQRAAELLPTIAALSTVGEVAQ
jgi:hypothetical protein